MRKIFLPAAAAIGLALAATSASATVFAGNWTLSIVDNSDPGHLAIQTLATNPAHSFGVDLGVNDPDSADLFTMFTNEGSIEADDWNPTYLQLSFNFTSPDDNNGPVVIGGNEHGYSLFGIFQGGVLSWENNGVAHLQWGANLPGVVQPGNMTMTVGGGTFNDGLFGTNRACDWRGHCNAASEGLLVSAEFDWDNDPRLSAAPEPASWALMIGGFGMAGAMLRRRRPVIA